MGSAAALAATTFCATGTASDRRALTMLRSARIPHLPATVLGSNPPPVPPRHDEFSPTKYCRSVSQL